MIKNTILITSILALAVSSAFAADVPKIFYKMDANNDNHLDEKEWLAFEKFKAERADKPYDEEQALKTMKRRDTNGDDLVSTEEFLAGRTPKDGADKSKGMDKKEEKLNRLINGMGSLLLKAETTCI